jgi:hypothetical protein
MRFRFGHVEPWWDDSFKNLDYQYLPIKNTFDEDRWRKEGYTNVNLNGQTYNMAKLEQDMPDYARPFLKLFDWENVGLNFYRQLTLDMFPLHADSYLSYRKMWNIEDPNRIWRCIVFLEDWKSGHYFEMDGTPFVNWKQGDYCVWNYNVPHFAANIGIEPRYTMQITGTEKL